MLTQLMMGWLATFLTGAVLTVVWEQRDPLCKIKYLQATFREFWTALVSILFTIILAYIFASIIGWVISPVVINTPVWRMVPTLPSWVRLVIAYLVKDFCYYGMHWCMHRYSWLWKTHVWHHSPKQLWWLVAQRTSFTSRFLFQIGFIAFPLLQISPAMIFYVGLLGALHENWTHLNCEWRSWMEPLEWIFVTPRYHSLHHTQIGGKNMGSYFTIFDRLFGTYVDPSSLNSQEQIFGSDEDNMNWRKAIGL